jgi:hypothetical protein
MVDIETLDTEPTSAILSIGAVMFDPNGDGTIDAPFHQNITFESALEHGTFSESTVSWWEKQGDDAKASLFDPTPVELRVALVDFIRWAKKAKNVWANSPSFDVIILRNACKECDLKWPFSPWVELDVRTLKNILPTNKKSMFKGTSHNPVDDAMNQVKLVQAFYKWIKD